MKKVIIILCILFLAAGVNGQENKMTRKERKAAREAEVKEQTVKLIEDKNWQFNAVHMIPSRGTGKTLQTEYRVYFNGEQLDSHLPFFGRAYRAEYGSMESPLSFKSKVNEYTIEDWKKGGWIIRIQVRNKMDLLKYTFTVSFSGSASLDISSTDREPISYTGNMVKPEKAENK